MDDMKQLLEDAVTADVLVLARMLKAEKASKGTHSTSDFIPEAISLLKQKQPGILQRLRQS